ncbi:hypothetical protein ACFVT1_34830 [Streptomyces sp. NPDC057963]|uniref:hypothetical protein n=1 Tax=Streptomyces sp. NPDC057963 TaxID=3346290 RepID=UPI0036E931CA
MLSTTTAAVTRTYVTTHHILDTYGFLPWRRPERPRSDHEYDVRLLPGTHSPLIEAGVAAPSVLPATDLLNGRDRRYFAGATR